MGTITKLVTGILFMGLIFTALTLFMGGMQTEYGTTTTQNYTDVYAAFDLNESEEIANMTSEFQGGISSAFESTGIPLVDAVGAGVNFIGLAFRSIGIAVKSITFSIPIIGNMINVVAVAVGVPGWAVGIFIAIITISILFAIARTLFGRDL